jgi:hypothetical protein
LTDNHKKQNDEPVDIAAIMEEGTLVDAAMVAGVRAALVRLVQADLPAVEWRDGRCVWIPPEEIKKRIAQIDAETAAKQKP